ncbi:AAA family ATPase [Kutzneria sp. NPDC051319]|uniref:AAA family ATPase n=1 Tax=Kutzneria sp. NPDC051319 TaxID=3155047 RepID=UPI00343C5647
MAPRFDITRVRLRNYKSVESCDVELGPLTLLVGPNGSGKSNFLDALQFVADALNTNLENAIRERGGMSTLTYLDSESFSVIIDFTLDGTPGAYDFTVGRVAGNGYATLREGLVSGKLGQARTSLLPPDWQELQLSLDSHARRSKFGLGVLRSLRSYRTFRPSPGEMVRPRKSDDLSELLGDGSNIAHILALLEPADKQRIEDYLGLVVPDLLGVDGRRVDSFETLRFRQNLPASGQLREFEATSMSDGTLRATGVLTALFSGTGVVGIEEPELALHPAAVGVLMDALRDASDRRQVLVTSHSSDLLEVPGIKRSEIVAVRFVNDRTIVGPLGPVGERALDGSLFTAGELLRTDQLQPKVDE